MIRAVALAALLVLAGCSQTATDGGKVALTQDQLAEIDATINLIEVSATLYARDHGGWEAVSNDKLARDFSLLNIAWNQYQTEVAAGTAPTLAALNSAIAALDADMGVTFVPVTVPVTPAPPK